VADSVASAPDHYQGRLQVALLAKLFRVLDVRKSPSHLLLQFSGVCARIWDNDGDFVLIEAAYSLPKWLKPETSKNRVWLLNGQLHVIPLPNRHYPTLPSSPTIQEALQILSSESVNTIAKAGVQEAIRLKIKGYPRKAQADMHRARCLLPAKIAHVLQHKPQLVSPAVQTFHYRDVQDMRAAAKPAHFQPQVGSCLQIMQYLAFCNCWTSSMLWYINTSCRLHKLWTHSPKPLCSNCI